MSQESKAAGLVLAGLATIAAATGVLAEQPAQRSTLQDFVNEADLVFRGEVVDIQYANSVPAADAPGGIPHRFVTFRVDTVLHGTTAGELITLRFFGGYEPADQTYLADNVSPQFDVGDQDILFVHGNGRVACPLVGERWGRLRVIGGQVYTDSGHSVTLRPDGAIERGERYMLHAVSTTYVLGQELWLDHDPEALVGDSDAMAAGALVAAASAAARRAPRPSSVCASVSPAVPFACPFPAPTEVESDVEEAEPEPAVEGEASLSDK